MFIQKVMERIWEPVSERYWKAYEDAKKLDPEEIFQRFSVDKMKYYPYIGVNMNYIDTLGCPYRLRGKKLAGCSMCDYQSEFAEKQGALLALREKDSSLYAQCVRQNFVNSRNMNEGNVIENLSGYDSLDYREVPEELCEELFKKDLFSLTPFIYNVEARVPSITRERLEAFSKTVSGKKRVSIDFGVEVSDEWLRNHWLNKDVTNQQIIDAVNLLHEFNFRAVGNVLLGIPGLTEEQCISEFVKSVLWMDDVGIDKIVIHVLNRKKYTLHGFIHERLSDNKELSDLGLVNGEHTGLPWLFTVIRALDELYKAREGIYKKAVVTRLDTTFNSITNSICYNACPDCECNERLIKIINDLVFVKNYNELSDIIESFMDDPCYAEYEKLLEKQSSQTDVMQTINTLSRFLAKELFNVDSPELCNPPEYL